MSQIWQGLSETYKTVARLMHSIVSIPVVSIGHRHIYREFDSAGHYLHIHPNTLHLDSPFRVT